MRTGPWRQTWKLTVALLLLLGDPGGARELSLEYAQEGEPTQPRALILIHNAFEGRDSFQPFFTAWAHGSWAREQYCSVYCYQYDDSGLADLGSSEELAKDLWQRIESDDVDEGEPDDINRTRRCTPTDTRQPRPNLSRDRVQLVLAGIGHGGLIARRVALLAQNAGRPAARAAYLGAPLDGLSTLDLVLGMTVPERAPLLGMERAVAPDRLAQLSPTWWQLPELYDDLKDWTAVFAPAYQNTKMLGAFASTAVPSHPTDNALYGRYRPAPRATTGWNDGWLPLALARAQKFGPVNWLSETVLNETSQAELTEKSAPFLLEKALDRPVLYDYLSRRQVIEDYVRERVGEPPLYLYWDERNSDGYVAQWRGAYASRRGLYQMMWGVGL